jgi:DNA-directed RNA polymerase subunit omega
VARVTVEDCLDKTYNRFSLVMLVAKRAKQIIKGSLPTVKTRGNKEVVTALREVAAGHVYYSPDKSLGDPLKQIEGDLNR